MPVPQDDDKTPDVNRDYVCVMDLGIFELSLRMEDKGNGVSLELEINVDSLDGAESTSKEMEYICLNLAGGLTALGVKTALALPNMTLLSHSFFL